jgi:hypothetical protein
MMEHNEARTGAKPGGRTKPTSAYNLLIDGKMVPGDLSMPVLGRDLLRIDVVEPDAGVVAAELQRDPLPLTADLSDRSSTRQSPAFLRFQN